MTIAENDKVMTASVTIHFQCIEKKMQVPNISFSVSQKKVSHWGLEYQNVNNDNFLEDFLFNKFNFL